MILIGQYDSPFVRRVGVALRLYGLPFRHEPWSTFADADRIRPVNPLTRVPTLVLADGTMLTDSHVILGYLDALVGPGKALWPRDPAASAMAFGLVGLSTGLADKTVSLFYESRLHDTVSEAWAGRCRTQIAAPPRCWRRRSRARPERLPLRRRADPRRHRGCGLRPFRGGGASGVGRSCRIAVAGAPLGAYGGDAGVPGDQPGVRSPT